jgi:hypothetical protein
MLFSHVCPSKDIASPLDSHSVVPQRDINPLFGAIYMIRNLANTYITRCFKAEYGILPSEV